MIYSSMVVHVGEGGTGKSRLLGPLEQTICISLGLNIKLRSSVNVMFIRPRVAHAVSRTNKIMVEYK